jgi:flagellar biosynthesis protein FlhF
MKIKTFYAKTMSEALRNIKAHLGPDAVLLSTKEVPSRSGAWGRSSGFEVVAANDNEDSVDVFTPSQAIAVARGNAQPPDSTSLETPRAEAPAEPYSPAILIKNHPPAKSKGAKGKKAAAKPSPEITQETASGEEIPFKGRVPSDLYRDLISCGVEEWLARKLLHIACDSLTAGQKRSRPAMLRSISQAALKLLPGPFGDNGMPGKKIVAFIGPTGVGKTTSIAKLAAHLALQKKKKVVLMTLDGYRIGAIEQLKTYAGLMGIPFRFVGQVSDLPRAIEDNKQRDYILIDTAGRGPRDLEAMSSLASFLKQSTGIERHLVLSATTKPSDMRKIMDQFEVCGPDHLLFTKLDETSTPGPILNELVRTRKAFSYYSDGQRVPDDLHAVPRERIIDIVLNRNDIALKG